MPNSDIDEMCGIFTDCTHCISNVGQHIDFGLQVSVSWMHFTPDFIRYWAKMWPKQTRHTGPHCDFFVAGFQHGLYSRLASSARSRLPHSAKSSYLSAAIFKFPLLPHSSPSNVAYLIGYPPLPYLVLSFDFSHIVMKNCMSPLVIDLGCQPSSRRIRQCIPSGCHAWSLPNGWYFGRATMFSSSRLVSDEALRSSTVCCNHGTFLCAIVKSDMDNVMTAENQGLAMEV
jgi:hypothetical protein